MTNDSEKAPPKSIVPSKYAGKYKDRKDDPLTTFINEQCSNDNGKVDSEKFFELCGANGIKSETIDTYRAAVEAKTGGAAGRARMTLGNMLNGIANKGEGLFGLDGKKYNVPGRAPTRKAA